MLAFGIWGWIDMTTTLLLPRPQAESFTREFDGCDDPPLWRREQDYELPISPRRSAALAAEVGRQSAREVADAYLLDHVGDALVAGTPRLSETGRWIVP